MKPEDLAAIDERLDDGRSWLSRAEDWNESYEMQTLAALLGIGALLEGLTRAVRAGLGGSDG